MGKKIAMGQIPHEFSELQHRLLVESETLIKFTAVAKLSHVLFKHVESFVPADTIYPLSVKHRFETLTSRLSRVDSLNTKTTAY